MWKHTCAIWGRGSNLTAFLTEREIRKRHALALAQHLLSLPLKMHTRHSRESARTHSFNFFPITHLTWLKVIHQQSTSITGAISSSFLYIYIFFAAQPPTPQPRARRCFVIFQSSRKPSHYLDYCRRRSRRHQCGADLSAARLLISCARRPFCAGKTLLSRTAKSIN